MQAQVVAALSLKYACNANEIAGSCRHALARTPQAQFWGKGWRRPRPALAIAPCTFAPAACTLPTAKCDWVFTTGADAHRRVGAKGPGICRQRLASAGSVGAERRESLTNRLLVKMGGPLGREGGRCHPAFIGGRRGQARSRVGQCRRPSRTRGQGSARREWKHAVKALKGAAWRGGGLLAASTWPETGGVRVYSGGHSHRVPGSCADHVTEQGGGKEQCASNTRPQVRTRGYKGRGKSRPRDRGRARAARTARQQAGRRAAASQQRGEHFQQLLCRGPLLRLLRDAPLVEVNHRLGAVVGGAQRPHLAAHGHVAWKGRGAISEKRGERPAHTAHAALLLTPARPQLVLTGTDGVSSTRQAGQRPGGRPLMRHRLMSWGFACTPAAHPSLEPPRRRSPVQTSQMTTPKE